MVDHLATFPSLKFLFPFISNGGGKPLFENSKGKIELNGMHIILNGISLSDTKIQISKETFFYIYKD